MGQGSGITDQASILARLKPAFAGAAKQLRISVNAADKYVLVSKRPSPFPQHKGHPMDFGSILVGKAYVSLHLMPIYMNRVLSDTISPALRKRMQGKSCFNFKSEPELELVEELKRLADAGLKQWAGKKWA